MIFCWLFGHRYDYDIRKAHLLALVCTRCGNLRVLEETKVGDLSTLPPVGGQLQQQFPEGRDLKARL